MVLLARVKVLQDTAAGRGGMQRVQVTIAPGSNSGKLLRLKGRGAIAQGRRGDLLARIVVTLPETPDAALIKFAEDWRAKRPYTPGR